MSETKPCRRCKKDKPLDEFAYKADAKDKKQSYCTPCASQLNAIRKMNPKIRKRISENHTLYMREWLKNPFNRTAHNIRSRNSKLLKSLINNFDSVNESTVLDVYGTDKQSFMNHLASLFKKGMSWKNYGAWHLDHKINLSEFNLLNPKFVKVANHFSNIRPLWATGAKGNLTRKKSPKKVYK